MFDPFYIIPFALGGLVGALVCWLVLRTTIERLRTEIAAAERFRERTLNSEEGEAKLREAFTAMSAEALAANNNAFLEQAKLAFSELQTAATGDLELRKQAVEQLVEPIRKGLEQVDSKLQAIDVSRAESQGAMQAMLSSMAEAQKTLTSETATLVAALRQPQGRGQWGELQLRRVVELAGIEPATSSLPAKRSSHLSYSP